MSSLLQLCEGHRGCIALQFIVLYCIVLYCSSLYCIVLYCIALQLTHMQPSKRCREVVHRLRYTPSCSCTWDWTTPQLVTSWTHSVVFLVPHPHPPTHTFVSFKNMEIGKNIARYFDHKGPFGSCLLCLSVQTNNQINVYAWEKIHLMCIMYYTHVSESYSQTSARSCVPPLPTPSAIALVGTCTYVRM